MHDEDDVPEPTPMELAQVDATPLAKPASGAPDPDGDETARGRAIAIDKYLGGRVAQLGQEIFMQKNGVWVKQTGRLKRAMLNWFGTNPDRSGLWDAALLQYAVDPNDEGQYVYFEREENSWQPVETKTSEVFFANGRYDIMTKRLTPDNRLIFGPLLRCEFDTRIYNALKMAPGEGSFACPVNQIAEPPAQFRELIAMIDFALGGDAETVKYFRSVVGQILRPHCGWNKFVHVHGESGARKTTIMRALLSAPCGHNGFNELSEAVLAENKHSSIGLVNRIANLSNDSGNSAKFATFIKEITSGTLPVEKKFHDRACVRLTAKLFATMNVPQNYQDDSLGVENRIIVFRFKPRADNNGSAVGTQWMQPTFYSEETRQWITHWLLLGLEDCIVDGVEHAPRPSTMAQKWREELLNESMPVRAFCKQFVVKDDKAVTPTDDFTNAAIQAGFCGATEHERAMFAAKFKNHVRYRFGAEIGRRKVGELRKTCFSGIALVDTDAETKP